ncbi:hypothetical protein AVEN_183188-1 [Araneus ventricosus]|uniref:Secreted protein n=1 Tax=Araneus ventricosus TaxID=182803 RepID=A0A4Y2J4T8_ARAVE|nr:hypothetical protein AVEN_183188-1 [Araneus ventricosus]
MLPRCVIQQKMKLLFVIVSLWSIVFARYDRPKGIRSIAIIANLEAITYLRCLPLLKDQLFKTMQTNIVCKECCTRLLRLAVSPSHTQRGGFERSKNLPLKATKACLRRLAFFFTKDINAVGGQIILANHSPFPCVLREGYIRGGVNDHPCWKSPIHVASFPKTPCFKGATRKKSPGD